MIKLFLLIIAAIATVAGIQEMIALSQGYHMPPSLQFGYAASDTVISATLCIALIILMRKKGK